MQTDLDSSALGSWGQGSQERNEVALGAEGPGEAQDPNLELRPSRVFPLHFYTPPSGGVSTAISVLTSEGRGTRVHQQDY